MIRFFELIKIKKYKLNIFDAEFQKIFPFDLYEMLIDLQNNINYYFIDFNHIFSEISFIFPDSISNTELTIEL